MDKTNDTCTFSDCANTDLLTMQNGDVLCYKHFTEVSKGLLKIMGENALLRMIDILAVEMGIALVYHTRWDVGAHTPEGNVEPLTDAEWEVLSNSEEWTEWLPEAMVNTEVPWIVRLENGVFGIRGDHLGQWYNPDGTLAEDDE